MKKKCTTHSNISKYKLYELSVQSPRWQVDYLPQFHQWYVGKAPRRFREDFCGSGKISCEWVKSSVKNFAVGLDIAQEPLDYAINVNQAELKAAEKKRIKFIQQDVLKPTREKFDFIGAFNYSFSVFHERTEMLQYSRAAFKSLSKKGTFFLEVAGGKGFTSAYQETQKIKIKDVGVVKQIWEQHQYDPISAISDYSIHFQLPDGKWLNDAFTYHWRIWQIRELREILKEAGFKKTVVLWEPTDSKGKGLDEYLPNEHAENVDSFVAYVVGIKK